jgi:hypothetical protein
MEMNGVATEDLPEGEMGIVGIQDGDWTMYSSFDISRMNSTKARVVKNGYGGTIKVRSDDVTGALVSTLNVPNTSSLFDYGFEIENIGRAVGIHDIYFVYKGVGEKLFSIDWFVFLVKLFVNIKVD